MLKLVGKLFQLVRAVVKVERDPRAIAGSWRSRSKMQCPKRPAIIPRWRFAHPGYADLSNNTTLKVSDDVIVDGNIKLHKIKQHEHGFYYLSNIVYSCFAHRSQGRRNL